MAATLIPAALHHRSTGKEIVDKSLTVERKDPHGASSLPVVYRYRSPTGSVAWNTAVPTGTGRLFIRER